MRILTILRGILAYLVSCSLFHSWFGRRTSLIVTISGLVAKSGLDSDILQLPHRDFLHHSAGLWPCLTHQANTMAEKSPKEVYHFVTFRGPSAKGTSRTAAEKSQARSHAAKVTHSRRKANRGQTILKWIVEDQASLAETPKSGAKQCPPASPRSLLSQSKVDRPIRVVSS